ncbi:hypothetical protein Vafri_6692 [Volvox africanus]|uniref:Uncharacterized protein n=1 Tax=Volvox africanus TaxID=51714 RepID=A0A8J4B0Q8_9CHLO|nr:hypothetical protein Vafri_6692 [Volvox africanus]
MKGDLKEVRKEMEKSKKEAVKKEKTLLEALKEMEERYDEVKKDNDEVKKDNDEVKKDNDEMKKKYDKMEEGFKKMEDRVVVLEEDSDRYRAVIKRHVVSQVHEGLQRKYGVKEEDQQWDSYLAMVFGQDSNWFRSYGLAVKDIALVEKGSGTPYEQGNIAAHRPSKAAVKRHIKALSKEDAAWTSWWKIAKATKHR